jgi:hypothetical protein
MEEIIADSWKSPRRLNNGSSHTKNTNNDDNDALFFAIEG